MIEFARRARVSVAIAAVAVLSGCASATVDGAGSVSGSPDPRPPCARSASSAPQCIPSPSPSPTPSPTPSPSDTGSVPSRWAAYARTVFDTPLGDPARLNVCAIAGAATLTSGLSLVKPSAALAASCTFDITGPGVKDEPSVVVSLIRDSTATPVPGAQRTTVLGQPVIQDPYDAKQGTCNRTLQLARPDVTTSVRSSLYGTVPGGETAVCGVGDAIMREFAKVASGATPVQTLPTATESVLSVDACKVSVAAGFGSLPLLAGSDTPRPSDFDTSCAYSKGSSVLYVSAGLLRAPDAAPDGRPTTVAGHALYDTASYDSVCQYTSKQADGETLEVYYSPSGADPTASTCDQVARALGRYLDVLGLR